MSPLAFAIVDKRVGAGTSFGSMIHRVSQTPSDDELDELPPLDGDRGDPPERDDGVDALDDEKDDSDIGLDDGEEAAPDERDLSVDDEEDDRRSWLGEEADAADLNLGDVPLVELRDVGSPLDDAAEIKEQDDADGSHGWGITDTAQRTGVDGGDEGPVDADEELRDEDLPALDADDEDAENDSDPVEANFVDDHFAPDEALGMPWAGSPWVRVGAPLAVVGATAIVCAGRGALVAGRTDSSGVGPVHLVQVDLEGEGRIVGNGGLDGTEIVAIGADTIGPNARGQTIVAAVLRDGRLLVSHAKTGDDARFELRSNGFASCDVVAFGSRLWVRTRSGSLFTGPAGDPALAHCQLANTVVAIARDIHSGLAALVVDDGDWPREILRGGPDGALAHQATAGPQARADSTFTARGAHLAYVARKGVARRGLDDVWRLYAWEGHVTALAFVDDEGTLLAATYSDADDTTGIVRLDVTGDVCLVARIGAERDHGNWDGRVLGMACDDARGVVWLAGGFGVAAFAVPTG